MFWPFLNRGKVLAMILGAIEIDSQRNQPVRSVTLINLIFCIII